MGQRMVVVTACMTAVIVPVLAAERKTSVVTSALEYFESQGDLNFDEFLARDRAMPIDERERARVIAAALAHGATRPEAHDLADMDTEGPVRPSPVLDVVLGVCRGECPQAQLETPSLVRYGRATTSCDARLRTAHVHCRRSEPS